MRRRCERGLKSCPRESRYSRLRAVTPVRIKWGTTRGDLMTNHLTPVHASARVGTQRPARDITEPKSSFFQRRYRASVRPTVKVLARIHLGLLRISRGGAGRRLFGGR